MGFQVLEDECIWMKAGIVNFRLCDNAYDCYNCPFDMGMRKAMNMEPAKPGKREQPGWAQYLKQEYQGASRPCRHALTGHIKAPKICTMNYECYHCPYDQMLDEMDLDHTLNAPDYQKVSGHKMANGYYYHLGHTWARFEHGGRVRVGFDDFLVKLFGPAQTISLPPLGATLKQNEVGLTFHRDDQKAGVLSPVSGTVLAANHKTLEHPEITHQDPYQSGWLVIMEPSFPKKNLKSLYFEKESFAWMEQEHRKLMGCMGAEYEHLASTGGEIVDDIYGQLAGGPGLKWGDLARTFLRTETV
jgi:glycine cleavage system H lipoate-binding protein